MSEKKFDEAANVALARWRAGTGKIATKSEHFVAGYKFGLADADTEGWCKMIVLNQLGVMEALRIESSYANQAMLKERIAATTLRLKSDFESKIETQSSGEVIDMTAHLVRDFETKIGEATGDATIDTVTKLIQRIEGLPELQQKRAHRLVVAFERAINDARKPNAMQCDRDRVVRLRVELTEALRPESRIDGESKGN